MADREQQRPDHWHDPRPPACLLGGVIWAFLALPIAATVQAAASAYVERYEVIEDDLTRDPVEKA